jgi:NAD(P)-dependent dehydrogenase (short-subunit alcohol dehydrogenase family)
MTTAASTLAPSLQAYTPSNKLAGKVALISGGDSGIGRAVSVLYAKEGADVAIIYLNEHDDAKDVCKLVEAEGRRCLLLPGDIGGEAFCRDAVAKTVETFGKLNILVNNAAEQHPKPQLEDISADQLRRTFETNVFGMFYLTKAALPHLGEGDSIINTTSVTAYRGSRMLIDYASTKGAIVGFTRSLAEQIGKTRKIRVNAVAPGPVMTPLITGSFPPEVQKRFGQDTFHGRPARPDEIAPSYVFLAGDDGVFFNGQTLHPNGGTIIGG